MTVNPDHLADVLQDRSVSGLTWQSATALNGVESTGSRTIATSVATVPWSPVAAAHYLRTLDRVSQESLHSLLSELVEFGLYFQSARNAVAIELLDVRSQLKSENARIRRIATPTEPAPKAQEGAGATPHELTSAERSKLRTTLNSFESTIARLRAVAAKHAERAEELDRWQKLLSVGEACESILSEANASPSQPDLNRDPTSETLSRPSVLNKAIELRTRLRFIDHALHTSPGSQP